jgi:hypothetical protein
LPTAGFAPGAPLPGSTLTYTVAAGLLTVNYALADPVTVSGDTNFFLLDFTLVRPIVIQLGVSTATYATSGPGGAFSVADFTCTTVDPSSGCGSEFPSTAVTLNNVGYLPEPSAWAETLVGLGALGAMLRRRPTPTTVLAGGAGARPGVAGQCRVAFRRWNP